MIKPLLIGTGLLIMLGYVGNQDQKTALYSQTIATCEYSYTVISGTYERECGKLIDQVQSDGKTEVLSDNAGNFWIETKGAADATCSNQTPSTVPTHAQCMANQYEANGDK